MYQITLKTIAQALNYQCIGNGDVIPSKICIDSRQVGENDLFVAISGEKTNGALFTKQAIDMGASALVVPEYQTQLGEYPQIICADGVEFVQKLALYMRDQFKGKVIAVTGSQGKTSTKDFLAHIIGAAQNIVVTNENQNNELGLPLTISRLTEDTEVLILEMGMSGLGEIDFLASMAQPHHAIITNIGVVHAEQLGSQDNIAQAKCELLQYLPKDGYLAIRKQDAKWIFPYLKDCPAQVIWIGEHQAFKEDHWAKDQKTQLNNENSFFQYEDSDGIVMDINIPFEGQHQVDNALLAISISLKLGIKPLIIQNALANAHPISSNRMEKVNLNGKLIINDSYNANPESMRATLEVLSRYAPRQRVACLGNMYDLGVYEESGHRSVGKCFAELKLDILITVGVKASFIADEAMKNGIAAEHIINIDSNKEVATYIASHLNNDAVVLIKGSHGMKMNEIVSYLQE